MRRALALLITAAAFLGACDTDTDPDQPTTGGAESECDPRLEEGLLAWAGAGFSGSIAVSTGGELECLAAYGLADDATETPNTTDTAFSIGSISKAFAAAAVLDLVDVGKLSLSDRAGELIPDLGGPAADATVEQLLLHTSGLTGSHGGDHEPLGRDDAVAAIAGLERAFEPGSEFLYSNAGYTLLALIVEEVSDVSYRDYLAAEILPLPDGEVAGGFWDGEPAVPGPRAIGYLEDGPTDEIGDFGGPHWALAGNGDLGMAIRDLAAWTHALFTGEIVSPESVDAIGTTGFDRENGESEKPGWVAYDESEFGTPVLASAGGGGDVGHEAVVVWIPEGERVIAIATNTPDLTAAELLQEIGPALAAGDPVPPPRASSGDVDPADVAAIVGTYQLDTGGSFEVAARDRRLAVSARGEDAVTALFPLPEGVTADDAATHEQRVAALLAGGTEEGRKERSLLESELGPIEDVEAMGTIVVDGELHTYVAVRSRAESIRGWYSVNEGGGVEAAEAPAAPPTLPLVASADRRYRPDDPTAGGPQVTVEFDGRRMTVSGPNGKASARLAGRGR